MKKYSIFRMSFLALLFAAGIMACGEDDEPTIDPGGGDNPNAAINDWVYDVLDEVYFWTNTLPEQSDTNDELDPLDYFRSLLFSGDRFSVMLDDYDALINALEGVSKEAGYEFTLFQEGDNVIAVLRYVKANSPAKDAGLQRGDVVYAINGQTLTLENYQSLIGQISENHTISYRRFNEDNSAFEDQGDLSLQTIELAENPNLMDTVYTIGTNKIGYFHYTFFSPGPGNTSDYDQEMDNIFAKFNAEGITDLIIDLRYNSGGSILSATNLGSLMAPNVNQTDVFYENVWNDFYMDYINTLDNADDILRGKFQPKSQNVGARLNNATAYILVGTRTASASELVINGLLPYMNIELIGNTTVGKNVGSIAIQDEDDPDNNYGMLPIVLKIFNSQGQSDYDNGFTPVGADQINENEFVWYPIGDSRDPLISRAIERITGALPGRISDELESPGLDRYMIERRESIMDDLPVIMENPLR